MASKPKLVVPEAADMAFRFGKGGILIAIRNAFQAMFPCFAVIFGSCSMVVALSSDGAKSIIAAVVGAVFVAGGLEDVARAAKAKEQARWAKFLADMVAKEGATTFQINHQFENIRPQLDELVRSEVAQATRSCTQSQCARASAAASAGGE